MDQIKIINMSKLNEDKYIGDTRYEKVLEQLKKCYK